jgi:hypothetical protein
MGRASRLLRLRQQLPGGPVPALDEATAGRVGAVPRQAVRCYLAAMEYTRLGFLARGITEADPARPERKNGSVPVPRWAKRDYPAAPSSSELRDWPWGDVVSVWVRVPDNWAVLDHDNEASRDGWRAVLGPAVDKAAVERSRSGSEHWYFRLPQGADLKVRHVHRDEGPSFDLLTARDAGVVAPPSRHHKGGHRKWVRPLSQVRELTAYEVALLSQAPSTGLAERLAAPPGRGQYHEWLLSVAGSVANVHGDPDAYRAAMLRIGDRYMGDHDQADTDAIIRDYTPEGDPEQTPASRQEPAPLLPDEFWETPTHPFLSHIRQAALYKMRSPDSILHAVLADVALLTHYLYQLPDLGSPGTLDLLVGIVANSGDGKGTSVSTADTLLQLDKYEEQGGEDDDRRIRTRSLGSGEGMSASYFEQVEEDIDGKLKTRTKRYAIGVRFVSAEGAEYGKLSERSGQTTAALIRSVFMGDRIGGTYVGQSKGKQLPPRQYRAVLILQLQPRTIRAILDEAEEGTPQRMLWSSPKNPRLPPLADLPGWPGPLKWEPRADDLRKDPDSPWHPTVIDVHSTVVAEVRQELYDRATGRRGGELDGHRTLLRLKVAALLGCLRAGRPIIGPDDWRLSGQALDTSDGVRAWAIGRLGDTEGQRRQATIEFAAEKATAVEIATQTARDGVLKVAERIRRYLAKHAEGATTRTLRDSTKGPHGRDRELFRPGLEHAQAEGWAEQKDSGLWFSLGDGEGGDDA